MSSNIRVQFSLIISIFCDYFITFFSQVYLVLGPLSLFFLSFFLKIFFWCGPFLKSLLNLLQYCFWVLGFFGHEACGILAPWPGIEPAPHTLESKVLTTELPGKSLLSLFWSIKECLPFSFYTFYLLAKLGHLSCGITRKTEKIGLRCLCDPLCP